MRRRRSRFCGAFRIRSSRKPQGPRQRVASGACLVALALILQACSDGPAAPPDDFEVSLTLISGNGQSGPAGHELPLPLVAKVTNPGGGAAADVLVTFRVVSGGGRPYAGAARSNAQGRVQDYWTLGPVPGTPQVLEVRAVRAGSKRVYATFTATATTPPSSHDQE